MAPRFLRRLFSCCCPKVEDDDLERCIRPGSRTNYTDWNLPSSSARQPDASVSWPESSSDIVHDHLPSISASKSVRRPDASVSRPKGKSSITHKNLPSISARNPEPSVRRPDASVSRPKGKSSITHENLPSIKTCTSYRRPEVNSINISVNKLKDITNTDAGISRRNASINKPVAAVHKLLPVVDKPTVFDSPTAEIIVTTEQLPSRRETLESEYRGHPTLNFRFITSDLDQVITNDGADPDRPVIDLHGMTVREAKEWTRFFLRHHQKLRTEAIEVVTGRGNNSAEGKAKIKPAIEEYLDETGLAFQETNKGGRYLVWL
ncbi:uncharacterized protein LOC122247580 isoform X2 [Penaeus japonicus]|uniref:uncharacterized protein LOC122247580 isoform X2 n=1 Tax=Penaeus japonicus TaxID=27405 RepID=UPI001C70E830|nr:uncharacterized protein LOC122247580 isoform X2 [Penaeus japonicus]